MNDDGIITRRLSLSSVANPYKPKWLEAFVKLETWRLTEFDRVRWIDADTLQLQNSDDLMTVPLEPHGIACAVDHEVFPEPSERVRLRMLQTGVFVVRPSLETHARIKAQLGRVESDDGSGARRDRTACVFYSGARDPRPSAICFAVL